MNTRGGNNGNKNNRKPSFSKGGSTDKNKQDAKSGKSNFSKPLKKDDKNFIRWEKPVKSENQQL